MTLLRFRHAYTADRTLPDGQPLWAYRYRLEGRSSERPQVGGFATRGEAEKALRKVLDRLGPGGGWATITLAEFVDEHLEMHQAASVTIAKLRWLLGKATAVLGEKRLAELSPRDMYACSFVLWCVGQRGWITAFSVVRR
jgi:hypothetical protein